MKPEEMLDAEDRLDAAGYTLLRDAWWMDGECIGGTYQAILHLDAEQRRAAGMPKRYTPPCEKITWREVLIWFLGGAALAAIIYNYFRYHGT